MGVAQLTYEPYLQTITWLITAWQKHLLSIFFKHLLKHGSTRWRCHSHLHVHSRALYHRLLEDIFSHPERRLRLGQWGNYDRHSSLDWLNCFVWPVTILLGQPQLLTLMCISFPTPSTHDRNINVTVKELAVICSRWWMTCPSFTSNGLYPSTFLE